MADPYSQELTREISKGLRPHARQAAPESRTSKDSLTPSIVCVLLAPPFILPFDWCEKGFFGSWLGLKSGHDSTVAARAALSVQGGGGALDGLVTVGSL